MSAFSIAGPMEFDFSGLVPGVVVLPVIALASLGGHIGVTWFARRTVRQRLHSLERPGLLRTSWKLAAAPLLAIIIAVAAVFGFSLLDGETADRWSPFVMAPLSIAVFAWAAARSWVKAIAPVRRVPEARVCRDGRSSS
ncbi:MAG: hypothetical protein KJO07_13005 [Deltaproteobacteria bacterium]|nr:hypothetical protein [Deltaproteobacteria bacterium]